MTTVVPTARTIRLGDALIRAMPTHGAESALKALDQLPTDQLAAFVALLAKRAANVICVPAGPPDLPMVLDMGRTKPGTPMRLTEAQRREAHRRYRSGERVPEVVAGEREYQRSCKRGPRPQRRVA